MYAIRSYYDPPAIHSRPAGGGGRQLLPAPGRGFNGPVARRVGAGAHRGEGLGGQHPDHAVV